MNGNDLLNWELISKLTPQQRKMLTQELRNNADLIDQCCVCEQRLLCSRCPRLPIVRPFDRTSPILD
jgi:hypothetical protein